MESTSSSDARMTVAAAHDRLRLLLDDMQKQQQQNRDAQPPRSHARATSKAMHDKNHKSYKQFHEFFDQPKYAIPRQERKAALRSMIEELRHTFERAEIDEKTQLANEFTRQRRIHGSDNVESKIVPAYIFHKFPKLPVELQRKIWSFAARASDSRDPYDNGRRYSGDRQLIIISNPQDKLWRQKKPALSYDLDRPIPTLLHACKLSRTVCLEVFHVFFWRSYVSEKTRPAYFNTDYGIFHIEKCDIIERCNILEKRHSMQYFLSATLLSLLLKLELGTLTGKLGDTLEAHFNDLQRIRHLSVSIVTFAQLPSEIWSLLGNLRTLKVVLCFDDFYDDSSWELRYDETYFLVPHPQNEWGRRAAWVMEEVTQSLATVKPRSPKWIIPTVEVVVGIEASSRISMAKIKEEDDGPSEESQSLESEYEARWRDWRVASADPNFINQFIKNYNYLNQGKK
ncbi:hypothetical protein HYFRA_00013753 [Hymenoscyphus fraxineus]|uniref:2EXR domain-containing protein n=1 Tax=Hymenoscyphus fraxineus TaxID=746836 RepID=A0A9N9Q0B1_9HELO|nr:hypothetical protein HYFRA_00013753 [Hymenoscyphus fraxineus]